MKTGLFEGEPMGHMPKPGTAAHEVHEAATRYARGDERLYREEVIAQMRHYVIADDQAWEEIDGARHRIVKFERDGSKLPVVDPAA